MANADAVHAVHVLDQAEVGALDGALLRDLAAVERDLLRVLNEPRVAPAELALEPLRLGRVLAERRREGAQECGTALHQQVDQDQALGADVARELVVEQHDVEDRLGNVRVDLGQRVGEAVDVDDDHLIGVLDAVVEVAERVEGHVGQVLVVDVLRQARAVRHRELVLQIREHRVGVCGFRLVDRGVDAHVAGIAMAIQPAMRSRNSRPCPRTSALTIRPSKSAT